jgi:transposase/transposase-like protein
MTQRERDRLIVLRKVEKGHISQKQAAQEMDVTPRQVRRMLKALAKDGDKAVIHGLKGRESKRKIGSNRRQEIVTILSEEKYHGFGPTLASEYLSSKHGIRIGREALRQIMVGAKLWRAKRQKVATIHQWRPRRSCRGELVQWDTSEHDWLEGRGPKLYLIHMIDDATSTLTARFVEHDSTEANMRLLWTYLERHGRPVAFYTDKASLFRTAPKTPRDQKVLPRQEREELPPTQIGRALQELSIAWQAAHSPQAKGRVERSFGTAQDRLVKGLRVAGVTTIEQANEYLEKEFMPWWNGTLTVAPANTSDAHRPLDKEHRLDAILSLVESRQVRNDYTVQFEKRRLQIASASIRAGLRGNSVQIEQRLDGSLAMRFRGQYLSFADCDDRKGNAGPAIQPVDEPTVTQKKHKRKPKPPAPSGKMRAIMEHLFDKPGPPTWKAGQMDRTRTRQKLD